METYDGALPSGIELEDAAADINTKVNGALSAARKASGGKSPKLQLETYKLLGKPPVFNPFHAPIETWAMAFSKAEIGKPGKIFTHEMKDSQYKMHDAGVFGGLAPVISVDNILVGTDKIGHFFHHGYRYYYDKMVGPHAISREEAIQQGDQNESETYGLWTTGVYSHADISANRAGLQFYEDLTRSPNMSFNIKLYLTKQWNEQSNPNLYGGAMKDIWRHGISGRWQGTLSWKDGTNATCQVNLKSTGSKNMEQINKNAWNVDGQYEYFTTSGSHGAGTLFGQLRNVTREDGAVVKVAMGTLWQEGGAEGQAAFWMTSLKDLTGTWGRGKSHKDGGTWNLRKM